ncbi:MAG: response regulator [Lachnospiraceae bacterium]|nr:response regulator [Lachnospiraceae bacterium]
MKTILAVDDSPANLTIVRELLKDIYKVNVVTSGEQALKFLEKKNPDLILLDVCMPEMDGIETLKRMREMPENAWKVVFLTALTDSSVSEQARILNVDGFITKPFSPDELIAPIVRLIGE